MTKTIWFLIISSQALPDRNISGLFDSITVKIGPNGELFDYGDFNDLENIEKWMEEMTQKYRFVEKIGLGKSFEDREISALKISATKSNNRNVVLFNGGLHAREWLSPAHLIFYLG